MRRQLSRLKRGISTKAERRFAEILKKNHIPFRTKVKVEGREIDFIVGKYAIDIDGHKQDPKKNADLFEAGLAPVHLSNREIQTNVDKLTKWFIGYSVDRGRC
jgi:very-short-patch-repair endonuclease